MPSLFVLSTPLVVTFSPSVKRCMSTAAADKQSVSSSPSPQQASSLQELLGISDAEAETIRRKDQTTRRGFENLTTAYGGRSDEESSGRSMGTLGSGSAFSESPQAPASYCFPRLLLDDLRAKPEDVKSLVCRRPAVLGWSAGAAEKVSRYLQARLGMRRSEVARLLLRHPEAGTKSVEKNVEVKVKWLRDNLDLGEGGDSGGVVKLLLHAPQILNLSVERSLDPTLLWLKDRLGVSGEVAAKIARRNPGIFWLSVESNLEPTLAWLQRRLETDEHSVVQMVTFAPHILSMNTHTGLEPKLAWLRDRVGLTTVEVCDVISKEPTILCKSVEENLEPTLAWFKDHLGLDHQAAREMFVAFPRLVGSSLGDNLKLKIPWLQRSLGLSAHEAVALAKRAPALLQYSIEHNLDPTVSFFLDEMKASEHELRESVMRNPKLLGYSLENRLRPRLAAMREANIEPAFSEHQSHIGRADDTKFQEFVERHRC